MNSLGHRLNWLRRSKGVSQKDLATALGLNGAAVSKYETNRTVPDAHTLKKIAEFFNVTTDYLVDNSIPYTPNFSHIGEGIVMIIRKIAEAEHRSFDNAIEHLVLKGLELYAIEGRGEQYGLGPHAYKLTLRSDKD